MEKHSYNVLSISDKVIEKLLTQEVKKDLLNFDFVIACGDLPYYYVENIQKNFGIKTFFVRGNHANPIEYGASGPRTAPFGAIDLHNNIAMFNDVILLGFEGSVRYREGLFMYSQREMWWMVIRILPALFWNKLIHGRYFDILVTHAPPSEIYEEVDHVHKGFKAYRWLVEKFKPSYHFHGHIHIDKDTQKSETIIGNTKIINTFGYCETVITPGKRYYQKPAEQPKPPPLDTALADFKDSRKKAAFQKVTAQITGRSIDLLPFNFVKDNLHASDPIPEGVKEIPLEAIVGSVGRYEDFTAQFFPKKDQDEERWVRVKKTMESSKELSPIDVYQVDEVFFVLDGNHRVSVARQRGDTHIKAVVSKVDVPVDLSVEDNIENLIIKAQQVKFLEDTGLDKIKIKTKFDVSTPGCYRILRNHISSHQYHMELNSKENVSFQDAVRDWLENTYYPIVNIIRRNGLLREFPGMSYTDLYLLIMDQKSQLHEALGWEVDDTKIIDEVVKIFSQNPLVALERWKDKILRFLRIDTFSAENLPTFQVRPPEYIPQDEEKVFSSILVPLDGENQCWNSLDQAILIAKKEGSKLIGLHVVDHEDEKKTPSVIEIEERFLKECDKEKIDALFNVEVGPLARTIIQNSRWCDLLVLGDFYIPENTFFSRLKSDLRTIIQQCPRPIFIVNKKSSLANAILAYDGSNKANEGLFLSAYLHKSWKLFLSILSISEGSTTDFLPLNYAMQYLDYRGIEPKYLEMMGSPGPKIVEIASENKDQLIILGGYGHRPLKEVIQGSTVDYVLRNTENSVLICK